MKKIIALLALFVCGKEITAQVNYFPWNNEQVNVTGSGTALIGTDLVLDPNPDKIYYVGNDARVRNYYKNYTTNLFEESVLNYNAPLAGGLGIVLDQLWNLYYVNQSGYIVRMDVTSTWQQFGPINEQTLIPGSPTYVKVKSSSRLAISFPNGNAKIYYTGVDNLIHFVEWTNSGWTTGCPTTNATPVKDGSTLLTDQYQKVYYVGTDNRIHNLYKYNGNWAEGVLNSSSATVRSYSQIAIDENGKIFYIASTDNKIHNLFYTSSWQESVVNATMPAVHSQGNFTYNNGNLIYLATTGKVADTYWDGCKWINTDLTTGISNCSAYSKWGTRRINGVYGNSYYFDASGKPHILKPKLYYTSNFVYAKGKKLLLNNSTYYAKGTNYLVDLNQITKPGANYQTYFLSPYCKSHSDWFRYSNDPSIALSKIDSDFQKMQNMGMNTVRLFGLFAKANTTDTDIRINCVEDIPCSEPRCSTEFGGWGINTVSERLLNDNFIDNTYLPLLQQVINIASAHNIRIVLHTGFEYANYMNGYPRYNVFVSKIANYFKTNPTLMAIDLMNEPDGEYINTFDPEHWPAPPSTFTKSDVCNVTQTLYNSIRNTGSKALVTIGNADIAGTEVWDPKVMAVDFFSPHFYVCGNTENCESTFSQKMDRMKAKIYYAQKTLDLPWMPGEIGFSAELSGTADDMGTIAQQNTFMQTTLDDSKNAGAQGYLWWAFQDAYSDNRGSYYGQYSLSGVLKPIGGILTSFSAGCSTPPQSPPVNYYNGSASTTYTYNGTVKNCLTDTGIENVIVIAFDANWGGAGVTYTQANGSFTLKTNSIVSFVKYYASGYNGSDVSCTQTTNIFWDYGTYTGQAFLKPANCTPSVYREAAPLDIKNDFNSELNIYPNPSQGFITILNESKKLKQVEVLNTLGQRLFFESDINMNSYSLTISSVESIVIIRVTDESGAVQSKKCIMVK